MEKWIGEAVGLMHIHRITQQMIGDEMGVTNDYVSMILRGVKSPKGAEERVMGAINSIIARKSEA